MRRLVREVIDGGGFPLTVTRQASNLYSVHEPAEHAERLPAHTSSRRAFPRPAYAALAKMLGWNKPSLRDREKPTLGFQNRAEAQASISSSRFSMR